MIKRFYDSILKWSERKSSTYTLATVSFLEASVFPIPPDPLLLALSLGKPKKSFWYACICSFFSVLGAVLGYFIGWGLWEVVNEVFFTYIIDQNYFEIIKVKFQNNALLAIVGAAFTPIPFKAFTLSAGVFKINLLILIVGSTIGRSARFFIEGGLIYFFGVRIKDFIEKYFNILTILVFILIIAIFYLIKVHR